MQEHAEKLDRWFESTTFTEFDRRVEDQTDFLKKEIREGELSNSDFTFGLELEVYAVDGEGNIKPIPDRVLEEAPFNPELGLHNAELNTDPTRFDAGGVEEQEEALRSQFEEADRFLSEHGMRLVLDSLWTSHGGDSQVFLTEQEEVEGYRFSENMRSATRYHALDNAFVNAWDGEIPLDVPGADHGLSSMLFECLATSIQPHLQVPDTGEFPEYYNTALRTMAPVLALSSNSPFLPPDLYNQVDEAEELVDETFHELRIPVFEQSVNPSHEYGEKKVRFPSDLESAEDAAEYVEQDEILAPSLEEWNSPPELGYREEFWEWNFKRKTFWRWVRPVIGAEPVDGANDQKAIRIEYRPLPTQPTVKDVVALQLTAIGLIHGLVQEDHPVTELDWETSKSDFYSAVEDGLEADLHWVNSSGEETSDREEIFAEVFRYARRGLEERGLTDGQIERYVGPIEERWENRMTPSTWKKQKVREELGDSTLEEAITSMQRQYIEKSRSTGCFTEWM
ncbi:MAG: hypothetical protein ABEK01_03240 [Candidatus Nanohaloarchaea archaeon]